MNAKFEIIYANARKNIDNHTNVKNSNFNETMIPVGIA